MYMLDGHFLLRLSLHIFDRPVSWTVVRLCVTHVCVCTIHLLSGLRYNNLKAVALLYLQLSIDVLADHGCRISHKRSNSTLHEHASRDITYVARAKT